MSERSLPDASQSSMTWTASADQLAATNVAWLMTQVGVASYEELHQWSIRERAAYWAVVIERLGLQFEQRPERIVDLDRGVEQPVWLPNARFNIVDSCFAAPADSTAIIYQPEGEPIRCISYGQLKELSDGVAANLLRCGFNAGDRIAVVIPLTVEAVAIYLAIIKIGAVVVGIADSFRPPEIASRLRIAGAVGVLTQDVVLRAGKRLPLYANVIEADAPRTIVVPAGDILDGPLRDGDLNWHDFLQPAKPVSAVMRSADDDLNILFSSGTTSEPKAIPWTQTVPIKCAADAHFHHDIHPGDVLVWPTSLGWMMGPWLIFASLLNKATIGLYYGTPSSREFGQFVQSAGATMLGVIPTLVKAWRQSQCLDGLDWHRLRLFSSTGECSNAHDMQWLMNFAGHKPVIEYCGGTEIGGGYITGTLARPCRAGTFNTPALGLDVVILDDDGHEKDNGELYIVPPSIGLSTRLLNRDHHEVYFADVPPGPDGQTLRRHGDRMERLADGYWRALGRADDTMNLGGIKISSAEIEETLRAVPGIDELAAVAVSPDGGPSLLAIFAVPSLATKPDQNQTLTAMQLALRTDLNPLFKIHDLVFIDTMPRTASNKIMRRTLRDRYVSNAPQNVQ